MRFRVLGGNDTKILDAKRYIDSFTGEALGH